MATAKKLPSGNYRVRVFLGKENGKLVYKSFTAAKKADAEYEASAYLRERKRVLDPGKMTVGEAMDRYITSKDAVLSPSTIVGYKKQRRASLQGIIDTPLGELTREMVQLAVNVDAKTQSPKTIRNAHGLLSAVLAEYHPDFVLKTRLPQKVKYEIRPPEDADIKRLLDATKGTYMEAVILLGACGGLRRSEMCALTHGDIDPKTGVVKVNKAVVITDAVKPEGGKKWAVKTTKTHAGTRDIILPVEIIDKIMAVASTGEKIIEQSADIVTAAFCRIRNEQGFSFRLHDLRHYNASIMLALGVPDKYAMERMGHATPNMLKNVYQHTFSKEREETSQKVNLYFKKLVKK